MRQLTPRPLLGAAMALSLLAASLPGLAVAAGPAPRDAPQSDIVPGVVLLGLDDSATSDDLHSLAQAVGADDKGQVGHHAHLLRVPPGEERARVKALQGRPHVRYAEPDYLRHAD